MTTYRQPDTINIINLLLFLEKETGKASNYIFFILCYLNRDQLTNEIYTREINKLFKSLGHTKQKIYQIGLILHRAGLVESTGRGKKIITPKGLNKARDIIKGYRKQVKDLPKPPKGLKINF